MTEKSEFLSEYNLLYQISNELYRNAAKALGLSECTFWILYALRDASGDTGLTQSELCSMLCLPKQTVHSAIGNMERDGYILRSAGEDRRTRRILLTPEGIRLAERTADAVIRAEIRSFDGLSENERRDFLMLFRKYTDLLKYHLSALESRVPEEPHGKNQVI